MAIEYDLVLGTTLPVRQVADVLYAAGCRMDLLDVTITADQLVDPGRSMVNGTWIRVLDATPSRPWNPVRDALGFTPTVRVVFRYDKFRDFDQQDADMVRLTVALLDRVPGDAVLHWQYERIWLLRRNGELSLNEASDIWPPDRLALVPEPYRRATYAFE